MFDARTDSPETTEQTAQDNQGGQSIPRGHVLVSDLKHLKTGLAGNDWQQLEKLLLSILGALDGEHHLLHDQKITIALEDGMGELTTTNEPHSAFGREEQKVWLFFTDVLSISLDALEQLEVPGYSESEVAAKLNSFSNKTGADSGVIDEVELVDNQNLRFEVFEIVQAAYEAVLAHINAQTKQEPPEKETDKSETTSDDPGLKKQQRGDAVTLSGAKVRRKETTEGGGETGQTQPAQQTLQEEKLYGTRTAAQAFQYQAAWLQAAGMHQIATQLGIDIDSLGAEQQALLRTALQNAIGQYLSDPRNLQNLSDLKNADIYRLEALREITRLLNGQKLQIVLTRVDEQGVEAQSETSVTLDQPTTVDDTQLLSQAIRQHFPNVSNQQIVTIEQMLHTLEVLNGSSVTITPTIVIEIFEQATAIRLSPDDPRLLSLVAFFKTFVVMQVKEAALITENKDTESGITIAGTPRESLEQHYSPRTIVLAETSKDEPEVLPAEQRENVARRAGRLGDRQFLKVQKMYGPVWNSFTAEQQEAIAAYIQSKNPQFTPYRDPISKELLFPIEFTWLSGSELKRVVEKKTSGGVVIDSAQANNSVAEFERLRIDPKIQEQLEVIELEQLYSQALLEQLDEQQKQILLNQLVQEQIAKYQAQLEYFAAVEQLEQQIFIQQRRAYIEQQLALLEAGEAQLADFQYAQMMGGIVSQERQQAAWEAAKAGGEPIPEGTTPSRFFKRGQTAGSIRNTTVNKATKRAQDLKELAKLAAAAGRVASGDIKALVDVIRNKQFRKLVKYLGLGGIAGGVISYILGGLKALAGFVGGGVIGGTVGGFIGFSIGGPLGIIPGILVGSAIGGTIGSAIGGTMGGWQGGFTSSIGTTEGLSNIQAATGGVSNIVTGTGGQAAGAGGSTLTTSGGGAGGFGTATTTTAATGGGGVIASATGAAAAAASALGIGVLAPAMGIAMIAGMSLYNLWIIQHSFLAPLPLGTPLTAQPSYSQYIEVEKSVTPSVLENGSAPPTQLTYTITIRPRSLYQVEIISATDTFQFLGKDGEKVDPVITELDSNNQHPVDLQTDFDITPAEKVTTTKTGTYTFTITNSPTDVMIQNTFEVDFIAYDGTGAQVATDSITATAQLPVGTPEIFGCWPTTGSITQLPYNLRSWSSTSQFADGHSRVAEYNHDAFDIANGAGTPIYAPFSGTAFTGNSFAGGIWGYGYYVVLKTNSNQSLMFAHMTRQAFSGTKSVTAGETIGFMGSTGNSRGSHLHYGILETTSTPFGVLRTLVPDRSAPLNTYVTSCYD
ncbi:MAG: peptidoglycan DD-metalloendopeptidase family protein [Pseudomonadales bacterium]|nr:peptidoglycan DD-metalloendopeptidase family protein [Pseudomonadales bacterium]